MAERCVPGSRYQLPDPAGEHGYLLLHAKLAAFASACSKTRRHRTMRDRFELPALLPRSVGVGPIKDRINVTFVHLMICLFQNHE